MTKRPVARIEPSIKKEIPKRLGVDENPHNLRPAWRVSAMEMRDPFGWHHLDDRMLHYLRGKLKNFESMTWNEILIRDHNNNHRVEVWKLCKDARDRLTELNLEDVEVLVSLRCGSTERIWGILEHNILSLLWWDPFHDVYPVEKRYT